MTARAHERGWPIEYVDGRWVYGDTGKPADGKRACRKCGEHPTPDGYDPCVGYVPGKTSVCCGHGVKQSISL